MRLRSMYRYSPFSTTIPKAYAGLIEESLSFSLKSTQALVRQRHPRTHHPTTIVNAMCSPFCEGSKQRGEESLLVRGVLRQCAFDFIAACAVGHNLRNLRQRIAHWARLCSPQPRDRREGTRALIMVCAEACRTWLHCTCRAFFSRSCPYWWFASCCY